MSIFGYITEEEFKRFGSEIRNRCETIENELNARATDSDDTARGAAERALQSEQRIKAFEATIESLVQHLAQLREKISEEASAAISERQQLSDANSTLFQNAQKTQQLFTAVESKQGYLDGVVEDVSNKVAEINNYLEQTKQLPESLERAKQLLADCSSTSENITALLSHSLKRKGEIDDLHSEIFGRDITGADGESEHTDGLRDALERSYDELASKTASLESQLKQATASITRNHETELGKHTDAINELFETMQNRYQTVNDQLTGLLPGAMAAGLSAAFEEKKADEVLALKSANINFRAAILSLVCISAIPFSIDAYLMIAQSRDLVQIMKDTPLMLAAILPLYFPVLWFAHTSNKKANLSKRLIEEYTHKAVLGKTFSGLSNQIETLDHQSQVKDELRSKLLANVLQVSAENPGKLITDYNKSDHPLMEALENSAKLADSLSTLSKIPGFSKIAERLAARGEEMRKTQNEKVIKGLDAQAKMEGSQQKDDGESNDNVTPLATGTA